MSEDKLRQPAILNLKDDVTKDRPDLLQMQIELQGYMEELLKLGVDVNKNLLPSFVAIREQESGRKGLNFFNNLETIASSDFAQPIFNGLGLAPKTLGSFQIDINQAKHILSKDKDALNQVNKLLETNPIDSIRHIDDPNNLTYAQLKALVSSNLYGFYFVNYSLTRTSRNLQSKARERGGAFDQKDIIYTTHFAQNHPPAAMYSAIVLQNILQLARSGPNPIDLRGAVDRNYADILDNWKSPLKRGKKELNAFGKDKIVLNGVYNEEFQQLIKLLKEKKGIDIQIQTSKDGYVKKINGYSIIDNETTIDTDKGFDVLALKQLFEQYQYTFYPLLSADFAEKNKNRVHDEYNYGFRKYVSNISPEIWAKRFESNPDFTELAQKAVLYENAIRYPSNVAQHGIERDPINKKAINGALDCVSRMKYLFLAPDLVPSSYTYLGQGDIDVYSLLGGVDEYHQIFAEKLDQTSIRMLTPQTYQDDYYFQIISHIHEGDIVGFGQEYPASAGGQKLTIQNPSKRKKSTELEVSMSHGGVVTRVTSNNVRVTMSRGQVGQGGQGVVEIPLFGPGGYYETSCLSHLQKQGLGAYKPMVFFGSVDHDKCETSMKERIAAVGERKVEFVDGVPSVLLDDYKVLHKSGGIDSISKKYANYCAYIARMNEGMLLAGTSAKLKIKFGDAKADIVAIEGSIRSQDGDFYVYEQDRGDGALESIDYKGFDAGDGNIISEEVLDNLIQTLDISREGYTGTVPLVWDLYIDTKNGHRCTIVYGKYQEEVGYFVIDTLRGPGKFAGGGKGICSLSDYFTTPGFYMGSEFEPYHKAFLRVNPVGIQKTSDAVPEFSIQGFDGEYGAVEEETLGLEDATLQQKV